MNQCFLINKLSEWFSDSLIKITICFVPEWISIVELRSFLHTVISLNLQKVR